MPTFKLTIEYDGTDFKGWQIQGKGERTVQGDLERVLSKIFGKRVVVIGSGRTDTGVHARGQVAHIRVETKMPADELQRAMNFHLPPDVSIVKLQAARQDFNAQFDARKKTYSYTVLNRSCSSPIERRYCYFLPRRLNLTLMRKEAKSLVGRHDFSSFANVDPSRTSDSIRTISRLTIAKRRDVILFKVQADGFLYKMVRNIVGTLLQVGTGRFSSGSVKKVLKCRDRRVAGVAAPAHGLCLEEVRYG